MRLLLFLFTMVIMAITSAFIFNHPVITSIIVLCHLMVFSTCEHFVNLYGVPFVFRDIHDKIHFIGSFGLSIFLTLLSSIWIDDLLICWGGGIVATNVAGLLYEFLQWKVLPSYQNPWFHNKPTWIVWLLSSDKKFDLIDMKYNFFGSIWFFAIYYLFIYSFYPNQSKK